MHGMSSLIVALTISIISKNKNSKKNTSMFGYFLTVYWLKTLVGKLSLLQINPELCHTCLATFNSSQKANVCLASLLLSVPSANRITGRTDRIRGKLFFHITFFCFDPCHIKVNC